MKTLIFWGNYNLTRWPFNVSFLKDRNSAGLRLQTQDILRERGVAVPSSRYEGKNIPVQGSVKKDDINPNIESIIKAWDVIFNTDEERFLRKIPAYIELVPTDDASDWTASNDAVSLAVDSNQYELEYESIGFDIDVSNSGNNYATLTYDSATGVDISTISDGNIEFSLKVDDVYYITSLDIKVGSSSGNYYSANVTANYEGRSFENGVIRVSLQKNTLTETGTVDDSDIKYFQVQVNYSSSMPDVSNCFIDMIQFIDEDRVRNHPCYITGEVDRGGEHYNISWTKFSANFFNAKGRAESTHYYTLFDEDGVTATSDTQLLDLDGSIELSPLINIDIVDSTGLGGLSLANLNDGNILIPEIISISDSDSFAFGGQDFEANQNGNTLKVSGKKLRWKPGKQRMQLNLAAAAPTALNFLTNDTKVSGADIYHNVVGQSFQATATGYITETELYLAKGDSVAWPISLYVYADDGGGSPDTASSPLGTSSNQNSITDTNLAWYTFNFGGVPVTSGVTYWLVIYQRPVLSNKNLWGGDPTLGYANGQIKFDDGSDAWTSTVNNNQDCNFKITIDPAPAWDVDWQAIYKKLYSA